LNREVLTLLLERFPGSHEQRRAVARAADDLAAAGRYETDAGERLTPRAVVAELADAPGGDVVERWNWWMGALDIAHGEYAEFQLRET
jgi:hypothetical protein